MSKYLHKYLYMVTMLFVLATSINVALYKINPTFNLLSYVVHARAARKTFYIVAGILCVYLLLNKQTYLPFLGECAVPSSVFSQKTNNLSSDNLVNLTIKAPNADKVIWWASLNDDNKVASSPDEAYNEYENSGVSNVGKDGNVNISFPCPKQYKVPTMFGLSSKILGKHVHYREAKGGMLSDLKTIKLDC